MGNARAAALVCVLVCAPAAARADDPAAVPPWAAGVSQPDKDKAAELLAEGNVLLDQGLHAQAIEVYRRAIALYDHPAIRYNIAVALISLQQPLEAYAELERALAYDGAALEADVLPQARSYQRLLESQIVHVAIDCVETGARVSLDAKDLGPCPMARTELVLAGPHQLVAEKAGYLTRRIDLTAAGGQQRTAHIDLMTIDEATVTRRRWTLWKPWAVTGAGMAVGLVGLGVELQSRATLASYDDAVQVLCPEAPCATLPPRVTDAYDRGKLENRIAISLFVTGGAVAVTGAVLAYVNRGVTERRGYDSLELRPAVAPDHAGVVLGGRF
jgi:tetratricopeptide (TPR) repeat protein